MDEMKKWTSHAFLFAALIALAVGCWEGSKVAAAIKDYDTQWRVQELYSQCFRIAAEMIAAFILATMADPKKLVKNLAKRVGLGDLFDDDTPAATPAVTQKEG